MALFGQITAFGRVRIDDEKTVKSFVDVTFQWRSMTVVEVNAERLGSEFVAMSPANLNLASPDPGHTVHDTHCGFRGNAWCADGCRH